MAAYMGLSILTTWPLITQLSTYLPGQSDDTLLHYWNGWWVQQAWRQGHSPYFTPLLFYPNGVSLITQNMAWFQILPWLLLEPFVGGIAAYNLALLLNLTFCGCACFLLVRKLTADSRAAFLAGLIYQTWPYRISQLDHPNLIATAWIPLFLLGLILMLETGKWRYAIWAGFCFAFVGYSRWQLLIPATLMAVIYTLFAARDWLVTGRQFVIGRLATAAIVAILLLSPPLWLLLAQQSGDDSANLLREGEETFMQTDILAFFTPSNASTLFHKQTEPRYDHYYPDRPNHRRVPAYLGITALLLSGLGLWQQGRKGLPWLVMALLLIGLALGSLLRIDGRFYPHIPTLYNLIPGMNLMRVPDRFNMFVALPVAVLAGYGLISWQSWPQWHRNGAAGLIGLLLLLEYLALPIRTNTFAISPLWRQLAVESGDFAILNLPLDPLRAKTYMYEQTVHQRPILQGNLSRFPDDVYRYLDSNPWLNTLRHVQEMDPQLTDVGQQLAQLAGSNIRYIAIHKTLVGADRVAHWQRYLLIQPRYEDETLAIYTTEPEMGQDFDLKAELGSGFGPVHNLISADCLNPGQILEVDVGWGNAQAIEHQETLLLSLVNSDGQPQQTATFPLNIHSSLNWGYYRVRLDKDLASDVYELSLSIEGKEQIFPLQTITVQPQPCAFSLTAAATSANVFFGDALQLLAYESKQNQNEVIFTLHWRAQQHILTDYKIFVHVFDPATGIPVAQDDARPRREAYPTVYWAPGEMLADRVPVSLNGVPAGSYGIAIGVYDPLSGDRLPVKRSDGVIVEDGRYILPEMIRIR